MIQVSDRWNCKVATHFRPIFPFHTLWKQKTKGFLFLSGGIEKEHWADVDQCVKWSIKLINYKEKDLQKPIKNYKLYKNFDFSCFSGFHDILLILWSKILKAWCKLFKANNCFRTFGWFLISFKSSFCNIWFRGPAQGRAKKFVDLSTFEYFSW